LPTIGSVNQVSNGYKHIMYEKDNRGVHRITLNRPEKHNPASAAVKYEMIDAFHKVRDDKDARIVVLTGAGKSFCSGRDMDEVADMTSPLNYFLDQITPKVYRAMNEVRVPIIAATKGWCLGVGVGFTLMCDIIVASEDTKFAWPEIIWDFLGPSVKLLKLGVPMCKAKELAWIGDVYDAKEAWRLGLVNKVVPREKLEEEVEHYIKKLLKIHPTALILSKISSKTAGDIPNLDAAGAFERALYSIMLSVRKPSEVGVIRFRDKKERPYSDPDRKAG